MKRNIWNAELCTQLSLLFVLTEHAQYFVLSCTSLLFEFPVQFDSIDERAPFMSLKN